MTDASHYGKSRLWWKDEAERKIIKVHIQLRYKDLNKIMLSQDDNALLSALVDSEKISDKLRALTLLFSRLEEQDPEAVTLPSEAPCRQPALRV